MQRRLFTSLVAVLVGAGIASGAPAAQPEAPEWQEDMSAAIEFQHDCEVAFISHVVERPVEGDLIVMAKVHCVDQRSFDAVRMTRAADFEFKECTLREKQSC